MPAVRLFLLENYNHMIQLTMLGTGYALATRCYNTCFLLRSEDNLLMVDAGGGNQIFTQLERADCPVTSVHHLFLTHAHTDHVLGAVWVVRAVMQAVRQGRYEGAINVYGNAKVVGVLEWMCRNMLPSKLYSLLGDRVVLHVLTDGDAFTVGKWKLNAFDIRSTKESQYGFKVTFPGGKTLVCLGDEPYNEANREWTVGADWLLSEAFCLAADADRFHPYEKHHSTALDAARLATALGVANLVLYHTEDKTANRKETYTAEAQSEFTGHVFVPDDLETLMIGE